MILSVTTSLTLLKTGVGLEEFHYHYYNYYYNCYCAIVGVVVVYSSVLTTSLTLLKTGVGLEDFSLKPKRESALSIGTQFRCILYTAVGKILGFKPKV